MEAHDRLADVHQATLEQLNATAGECRRLQRKCEALEEALLYGTSAPASGGFGLPAAPPGVPTGAAARLPPQTEAASEERVGLNRPGALNHAVGRGVGPDNAVIATRAGQGMGIEVPRSEEEDGGSVNVFRGVSGQPIGRVRVSSRGDDAFTRRDSLSSHFGKPSATCRPSYSTLAGSAANQRHFSQYADVAAARLENVPDFKVHTPQSLWDTHGRGFCAVVSFCP